MAAKRRTKMQIAHDRAEVAVLNAEGATEREIAAIIGVSQSQIHYDIVQIRKSYMARTDAAVETRLAVYDARNEELFRTYQDGYEKSIDDDTETGDPKFLQGAERRIDRYAKFHGLDAPDKSIVETVNPEHPTDIADAIKQRYAKSDKPDAEQPASDGEPDA